MEIEQLKKEIKERIKQIQRNKYNCKRKSWKGGEEK